MNSIYKISLMTLIRAKHFFKKLFSLLPYRLIYLAEELGSMNFLSPQTNVNHKPNERDVIANSCNN